MAVASTWPLSRQTALDLNGDVVPEAKLYFFAAGTTTPLVVYSDPGLTTPLPAYPDPILADASGRWPRIFMPYTDYRERVTTPTGTLLWDDDGIANPAPPSDGGSIPASQYVQTGSIVPALGNLEGFVRLNGLSIGNGVSGASQRANDDTAALFYHVYDSVPNDMAPVSGGRGSNAQVDFAAGKTLSLPDFRGRSLAGLAGMGNTLSSILSGVTFGTGGSADVAASQFGTAFHTLLTAQIPIITPSGTVTITSQGTNPAPSTKSGTGSTAVPQVNDFWMGTGGSDPNSGIAASFTGSSFGSGQSHPNTQPSGLVVFNIKL